MSTEESVKRLYLSPPHLSGNERRYVDEVFESNWIAPLGPAVDCFEKELAEYTGSKHVAALSSGTSAIHLALILLGVGQDDYVAVQSFTFSGSVNPVVYLGAMPILVDSERETWNLCPELLERAILDKRENSIQCSVFGNRSNQTLLNTEYRLPNTKENVSTEKKETSTKLPKAIIGVNLYGMPAKWDEILAIGEKYNIPVIEDAAESLGSRYDGRMSGSIGKFAILSFNGNKIITTSGGGALLSDDEAMIKRARFLASQSRDKAPHYQHSEIGYNYRMSNILAAVGRGQLEVIEERVKRKREINRIYREALADIPGIEFQTEPSDRYFSNYWLTTITVDPRLTAGVTREDIRLALEEENIESRPLWKPMHLQPVFAECPAILSGVSEALFRDGLCLPSGTNMADDDFKRVVGVVRNVIKQR